MIADIRLMAQQLAAPSFDNPLELVTWMGAVQAQDYNMVKWALGVRLENVTIDCVNRALQQGEIIRTHVLRPTWHLVAAKDIRWMLKLSAQRILSANDSFARSHGLDITRSLYTKYNDLIGKVLEGNKSLTKQEIVQELGRVGVMIDISQLTRFMMRAEAEGIICSGVDKGNKPTYALLDERVPKTPDLYKDEALALLARRYFQSHSPASLNDFIWWSGLSVTESKQAVGLIEAELIMDKFESTNLFVHETWNNLVKKDNILHFLPSFDEYLISYKDRTAVMDIKHYPKAFNNYGTFYPVIVYNGKIVGNWNKSVKKNQIIIETSFFEKKKIDKKLIKSAENRYIAFINQ